MQAGNDALEKALHVARDSRSNAELQRLALVDELQRSVAEVAALAVEGEEAARVRESLKQAAAAQQAAATELRTELEALSAEHDELVEKRRKRCTALEAQFQQALQVPAQLRTELRESEGRVEGAVAAEGEARQTTALLQAQLEELHRIGPERLNARSLEVAALHKRVEEARRTARGLEEALSQRRIELQARELGLEQRRRKDASLELGMYQDA